MVKIRPYKISGNWREGFALDLHTTSSEFMGHDEFGRPVFDTTRSEIGELQRRLEILQDAFTIKASLVKGENILLFDDLYRSGATINAVSGILYKKGMVNCVDVLTLTRTRRKK